MLCLCSHTSKNGYKALSKFSNTRKFTETEALKESDVHTEARFLLQKIWIICHYIFHHTAFPVNDGKQTMFSVHRKTLLTSLSCRLWTLSGIHEFSSFWFLSNSTPESLDSPWVESLSEQILWRYSSFSSRLSSCRKVVISGGGLTDSNSKPIYTQKKNQLQWSPSTGRDNVNIKTKIHTYQPTRNTDKWREFWHHDYIIAEHLHPQTT